MGEVYRAFRADDQYRKQVAVKVVRRECNSQVVERFRKERQILGACLRIDSFEGDPWRAGVQIGLRSIVRVV
jgi:hypothetical protein